jgi:hypothetical protein
VAALLKQYVVAVDEHRNLFRISNATQGPLESKIVLQAQERERKV